MVKRVVVAFDSFKGSLSAREANSAFARGLRDVAPDVDVISVPLSDGGEGFAECVDGERVEVEVSDPLGRRTVAHYTLRGDTAIIALASASGLTLLAAEEPKPLVASTYGTGELVIDAARRGCRKILLGLGGSATNDGGAGLLRALGFRFMNDAGEELTTTIDILERTTYIIGDVSALGDVELAVAVDVDNPLCGARGAAEVYARQKGASEDGVVRLERAMQRFAAVVARHVGADHSAEYGMGAAGGAAFGLRTLLGACPTSGIELILGTVGFDTLLRDACLVVTGEGRVDAQTTMGKAPSGVLHHAQHANVPCVAVGGSVTPCAELDAAGFAAIYAATPATMPLADAMQCDTATANLRDIGRSIARKYVL